MKRGQRKSAQVLWSDQLTPFCHNSLNRYLLTQLFSWQFYINEKSPKSQTVSDLLPLLQIRATVGATAFCLLTRLAPKKADDSKGWYNRGTYYSLYSLCPTGKPS